MGNTTHCRRCHWPSQSAICYHCWTERTDYQKVGDNHFLHFPRETFIIHQGDLERNHPMAIYDKPNLCVDLDKLYQPTERQTATYKGQPMTERAFVDDATKRIVTELRTLKAALETIAGRPTPTSMVLGQAISELCFQDSDRQHKRIALAAIKRETVDNTKSDFWRLINNVRALVEVELSASRRAL